MLENQKPPCFGEAWSPQAVECKGGLDPGYRDESTGSQYRELCECFEACGSRTQGLRLEEMRGKTQDLISAKQLIRPTAPPAPVRPTTSYVTNTAPPVLTPLNLTPPVIQAPRINTAPQIAPVQMSAPTMQMAGYQPMAVNYHIPSYLSVPEPMLEGERFFAYALRVLLRAMLKGGAQGLASLFDTTPLKK